MICLDQFQYPLVSNLRASCVIQLTIFTKVASRVRGFTRELPCIERTYYKSIVFLLLHVFILQTQPSSKCRVLFRVFQIWIFFFHLHLFFWVFPGLDLTLGVLSTLIRLLAVLPAELVLIYLPTSTFGIRSIWLLVICWNRHHNCWRSPYLTSR